MSPPIIRYFLGEEPMLDNVETFLCSDPAQRQARAGTLDQYRRQGCGRIGRLRDADRPYSTAAEREEFRARIEADPRNYIAQPTLQISRAPCFFDGSVEPRHVDLRPYILYGDKITIVPGGLTRVALRKGSLVVNSSQGGGSKDTWVLHEEAAPMLSRVADNLYWMSRYLERAEHTARVMGVQWNLMLEYEPGSAERRWNACDGVLGRREPLEGDRFRRLRRALRWRRLWAESPRRAKTPGRCASRSVLRCGKS
jgi:hypothetical protein